MNIEIVDFYPIAIEEDEGLTGTIRVRLLDFGIDILGIFVQKRKDSWYFTFPGKTARHHKTGEEIRYPFIVFEDREKQKVLMAAIRAQGRDFIEQRLADTENPLWLPVKKQPADAKLKDNTALAAVAEPARGSDAARTCKPVRVDAVRQTDRPAPKAVTLTQPKQPAAASTATQEAKKPAVQGKLSKIWIDPPKRPAPRAPDFARGRV